jgi:hypothetical protein
MANEKRVRVPNAYGVLGAVMLAADTTISFAVAPAAVPTIDSTKHLAIIVEPDSANEEVIYLTAYTAGQTTGTILRAQEGTTAVQHPATAAWLHGPTKRDMASGRVARAGRTAGNLSLSATAWTAIDTGLDLAVTAQAGDMIEACFSGYLGNEAADWFGDYCTLIGSTLTTSFATGAAVVAGSGGASSMRGLVSQYAAIGGPLMIRAAAGDISAGLVTVRFVYRVASGTRTLFASSTGTNVPVACWLKNHGPQEA